MIPKNTFSPADLRELEEFLLSGKTPDECMDISSLHGYLTSLAIGPETVMPSKWLPEIWGGEMEWDSTTEAEQVMGLIISFFNTIIKVFTNNPDSFKLLLKSQVASGEEIILLENWCTGFMVGVDIAFDSWELLFESEEDKELMTPVVLFGTDRGRDTMLKIPESSDMKFDNWVDLIQKSVRAIHSFWLPYRKDVHQSTTQAVSQKVGRNEPCPCGSGKKFKNCCMN